MTKDIITKLKQILCKHTYTTYYKQIDATTSGEVAVCDKCLKEEGCTRPLRLASWRTLWRN
jgi:hypothetical protein